MPTVTLLLTAALAMPAPPEARADASEAIDARVESILNTPGFQNGRWGLLVVEDKSGQVIYQRNPDQLFRPASVTKLFTTAAALTDLGADYRFQTPVVRTGEVDASGTLHGDLVLVASGDLSLGGRTGPDGSLLFEDHDHSYANPTSKSRIVSSDPLAGLDHLAREIVDSGIKVIDGDVLIDDRLFEPASSTGSGPTRVTPIIINDNVVDVVVTPGAKAGEPATVKIVPETSFVSMDALVETTDASTTKYVTIQRAGPRRFTVRGRVPAGGASSYHIYEVEEPAAFARALFIETLRRRGVRVSASPLADNPVAKLPPRDKVATLPKVAQYTSPPLSEYVRVILKVSQNLHASTLPLLIASHHGQRTLEDGLKLEGQLLKGLGVDVDTISFGGGAGGSRSDLVTPRATVALLRAMTARPDYLAYEAALPILGRDGTLADSVSPESPARGHVRAKTGTYDVRDGLTGKAVLTSKALAGFMETASGRKLIFAFFVNDVPLRGGDASHPVTATEAGRLLGRLCEIFYDDAAPAPSKPNAPAPVSPSAKAEAGASDPAPATGPAQAAPEPAKPGPRGDGIEASPKHSRANNNNSRVKLRHIQSAQDAEMFVPKWRPQALRSTDVARLLRRGEPPLTHGVPTLSL